MRLRTMCILSLIYNSSWNSKGLSVCVDVDVPACDAFCVEIVDS